ncbi:hypothetical protein HDV03_002211 [Kappamyces sp. JEL0829]|nr:hypothetical protein HDV03_002211 [Kappamyces sp. JEL0829]
MATKPALESQQEIELLLNELGQITTTEKGDQFDPESDQFDIAALLKQLENAGKVMDLIDSKADALLEKMDDIILELDDDKTRTDLEPELHSAVQRGQLLRGIAHLLRSRKNEFAELEALAGKPIALARMDVDSCIDVFAYYASLMDVWEEKQTVDATRPGWTLRQPLGLVGLIVSFNYPLLLLSWKLAPALAAGNVVLAKPAPQTPHSARLLARLVEEMQLAPAGVFDIVEGDGRVGMELVQDVRVSKISFTGSTAVGKKIAVECAQLLKPCTLELGGKNAAVVARDADLAATIPLLVDGAFTNAGQNCCALSLLYIHRSVYGPVLERLKQTTQQLRLGHPSDSSTEFGSLVDHAAYDRVAGLIRSAQDRRLECWTAGRQDRENRIIPPTIFTGVTLSDELAMQEIFGPVLCVMEPFDDWHAAVAEINSLRYGLASGIFTRDAAIAEDFARKADTGMVWVNHWNDCPPHLPFGGFRDSGLGKELGVEAIRSFTKQKSVLGHSVH